MPDQLHPFLVLVTSGSRVPDEVPDDDGRVGRTGDEDLVVVLEAQDRSLVTAQNVRRLARSDVPNADRAVALCGHAESAIGAARPSRCENADSPNR